MKTTFFLLCAGLILSSASVCMGAVYYWDGTGATVTSGSDTHITSVGDMTRVNAGGDLTGTSSPGSPGSGGSYFVAAAKSGAIDITSSTYFQMVLTPATGYAIQFDSISLYSRSTSSGPTTISVYSSIDSYTTPVGGAATVATDSNWSSLLSFSGSSLTGSADSAVTFRIYGSGGSSASTGNWRIDDISLNVTPVPEPTTWALGIFGGALGLTGLIRFWKARPAALPLAV